VLITNILD